MSVVYSVGKNDNATIQIRNALALEFILTKNAQQDKMLKIIDKMLVS